MRSGSRRREPCEQARCRTRAPVVPGGSAGRAWRALRAEPSTPDALALRLGLDGAELARVLVVLELDGLLAREPDGRLVALSGVGTG